LVITSFGNTPQNFVKVKKYSYVWFGEAIGKDATIPARSRDHGSLYIAVSPEIKVLAKDLLNFTAVTPEAMHFEYLRGNKTTSQATKYG